MERNLSRNIFISPTHTFLPFKKEKELGKQFEQTNSSLTAGHKSN